MGESVIVYSTNYSYCFPSIPLLLHTLLLEIHRFNVKKMKFYKFHIYNKLNKVYCAA